VTWQVAVYALLGLVLAGGFAWYERSRPPARMVALVAALAALAVAGRLVLAPIPNVVATTDIVLITGYAVGGAPGFAVGALAAVVSNLWLGQGPWTPWEMAGWGLVGIGGAALAFITRRGLGRVGLAAACAIAGFAYGALLDLSVMVGYGGEQSLDRYLAISARGVPFNVAHAAGNLVFALAAGPALVRMISRYRSRFEFEWRAGPGHRGPPITTVPIAILAVAVVFGALASTAMARGSVSATRWIERVQNGDGGFPASAGGSSSAAITGWAALGLEAAGRNPLDVRSGGHSPIGFLRTNLDSVNSTGDLERTILALDGAGVAARRFGDRDLVAELRRRRSRTGSFESQVNLTAFGILALRSAGAHASAFARSAAWLRDAENRDGGWGFQPDAGSDPDSTGAALQGLAASGGGGRATRRGASYLRSVQQHGGGFALAGASTSNSQSTAWAIQGLVAAGANPAAVRKAGRSPFDYLAHRQAGDGHYRYSSSSDQTPVWVTGQTLLAVNGKAFPVAPVPRAKSGGRSGGGHASSGAVPSGSPAAINAGGAASGPGGSPAHAASAGGGGGRHGGQHPNAGGAAGERVSALPASAPISDGDASQSDGGGATAAYVAGGLAALAAALAAGFLWYRRRLP
jgi:energy-coupling factor transport system substrate-specific component